MNKKFFELPLEKQERIIKAAYMVFAHDNYKNASMSRIADDASLISGFSAKRARNENKYSSGAVLINSHPARTFWVIASKKWTRTAWKRIF